MSQTAQLVFNSKTNMKMVYVEESVHVKGLLRNKSSS